MVVLELGLELELELELELGRYYRLEYYLLVYTTPLIALRQVMSYRLSHSRCFTLKCYLLVGLVYTTY